MSRLPIPGQDAGSWGDILNDYLGVEHNADGSQKTLDVTKGGTGATDAATARGNLGAASVSSLSAKADDNSVVHLAGNETVTGAKNFTGGVTSNGNALVDTTDNRLSDARAPLAHAASHLGGSDNMLPTMDPRYMRRLQLKLDAWGIKGETYQWGVAASGQTFTSGDIRSYLIGMLAGDVVNNIVTNITAAGSGITHAQAGIFTTTGTLLAKTGDTSADRTAFQTAAKVVLPIAADGSGNAISSLTIPSDGAYYISMWLTFTGSSPTFVRGVGSTNNNMTGFSGGVGLCALQTANSSFLTTPAFQSNVSNVILWFGWN